jgi:LmbE family N-acetylglucosaminyl deacetylase
MKNPRQEKPRLSIVEESSEELLRILLVDCEDDVTFQVRRTFETCQCAELIHTANVEEAAGMVATQRWDLLAVDPTLPGSLSLLKQIKKDHRWVAILVLAGNQDPQFMWEVVESRIDGLMFKPIVPAEFMNKALSLAEAVRGRRRRQQKRVLAIGAHPDDVEIGCGGSLAKHQARGDVVHILTLSRGAGGGDVNVRTAEAQRAAQLLGARLQFGNLPDTRISDGVETIEIIEAAIRELRPTHVYTHCAEDTHQDHRAVNASSIVAARGVANVYCYQAPSWTVEFRPNRFVDITAYIKQKIEAVGAYRSQIDRMESLQPDSILTNARYWSRLGGSPLVEPMSIVRQRDGDMALERVAADRAPTTQ